MDHATPSARAAPPTRGVNPRYERWRWQIFAITWLAYFGFYLTRRSFAVAKIGIKGEESLGIDDTGLTHVELAYAISYAAGQFVWGVAGDRLGPRWLVLSGLLGSVVVAVLMGMSSMVVTLGICFCLQGCFQSTGWAPLTKNVSTFFSRHERGVVFALWSTNYAVGGLVGGGLAGWCGDRYGWRYAFYIPAAVVLVIATLFWLFQRNRPEDVGLPPIEQYHGERGEVSAGSANAKPTWNDTWAVVTDANVMILALVYFLVKPARYALLTWGPRYLNDKLGSDMTESGWLSGLSEAAGVLSIIVAGLVSDKVFKARRMPVCVISLLSLAIVLFALDRLPAHAGVMAGAFLLIGFLMHSTDSIVAGVAAADFGKKAGTSTAAGWINGWGAVGAIVGSTLPGYLNQQWGWTGVFTFFAGAALLAGLILLPRWNAVPRVTSEEQHA